MFKVSSFNIRCYGLGGEYSGRFGDEGRNDKLRAFIKSHLQDCDVMIFQEIVDLEGFFKILPPKLQMKSYPHSYKRHQHIVICYNERFDLVDDLESDYIIEGVALNTKTSRPIMYGVLVDRAKSQPLMHVFGVHLKSGKIHSASRIQQVKVLARFIESLDPSLPVIVGGDFNTQLKQVTGHDEDDMQRVNDVLSSVGLKKVLNSQDTYQTPWESHCLDHFWASGPMVTEGCLWVYDVKSFNDESDLNKTLKAYYEQISDHLPIIAQLKA